MSKFITELQVSLNEKEEIVLINQNFTKIPVALTQGGKSYLWYKKGDGSPVTRIQFSIDANTSKGPNDAGYTKIDKNLNEGLDKDPAYLWYNNDSSGSKVPITDIDVTTNHIDAANMMTSGWQPVACELYWSWNCCKTWIRLWVKREKPTYIKEVMSTNHFSADAEYFNNAYIRLDENINGETDGTPVYLWYLPTTDPAEAIKDLQVSINQTQVKNYEAQHYKVVDQDLNEGAGGNPVYLWYKKDGSKKPIQSMTFICKPASMETFQSAGVTVINENLNPGNRYGQELLLIFFQ